MEWQDEVSFEDVHCDGATDKALHVYLSNHDHYWVPQSQVSDNSEVYLAGHIGKLIVSRWWARKNGLSD